MHPTRARASQTISELGFVEQWWQMVAVVVVMMMTRCAWGWDTARRQEPALDELHPSTNERMSDAD